MKVSEVLDRVGCYVLPGASPDPSDGLVQARQAESLGARSIWIGERYDSKDLPSLAGAIGQVTQDVGIGAAVTHPGLRHPMVLASMGQTLQALTGNRFSLGLGRSASWRWNSYGVKAPTLQSFADIAKILRSLWSGQNVSYRGPVGDFPQLMLPQVLDVESPDLLLAAVGPKTLALAGACYDGVLLHPLLTPEGVGRSIRIVRDAAEQAGRDPESLRYIAAVVVVPDADKDAVGLALHARAAGYLSVGGLGRALVNANQWPEEALEPFIHHPHLLRIGDRPADKYLSRSELIELAGALPQDWLTDAAAVGSAARCLEKLKDYLGVGVSEVILHGSGPAGFKSLFAQRGEISA